MCSLLLSCWWSNLYYFIGMVITYPKFALLPRLSQSSFKRERISPPVQSSLRSFILQRWRSFFLEFSSFIFSTSSGVSNWFVGFLILSIQNSGLSISGTTFGSWGEAMTSRGSCPRKGRRRKSIIVTRLMQQDGIEVSLHRRGQLTNNRVRMACQEKALLSWSDACSPRPRLMNGAGPLASPALGLLIVPAVGRGRVGEIPTRLLISP